MKKVTTLIIIAVLSIICLACMVGCDNGGYIGGIPSTTIKDIDTLSAVFGRQYVYPVDENLLQISVWSEEYRKSYKAKYYDTVTEAKIAGQVDGLNYSVNLLKGKIDYDYCTREYDEVLIKFANKIASVMARVIPGEGVISRNITYEFFYERLFYQVDFTIAESKEPSLERVLEAKESALNYISNFKFYQ